MEQTDMSLTVVQKIGLGAAIVGGGAMIAVGGVAVYGTQGAPVTVSADSGATPATTTPPTTPAIASAAPSITGPAPLFAGQAPNSNPQAAIP
jgi:hypothetical protein